MIMETKSNTDENKSPETKKAGILAQIITGRIFVNSNIQKHLGYIVFVFFLAVVYIGYRYKVQDTALENKKLDTEIKALHTEYINRLTELMNMSKRSEVLMQIQKRNITLKESQSPFTRIKID